MPVPTLSSALDHLDHYGTLVLDDEEVERLHVALQEGIYHITITPYELRGGLLECTAKPLQLDTPVRQTVQELVLAHIQDREARACGATF